MNLLDALTELVAFAREHGADEMPRVQRACRRVEERIARLAQKASARASGRKCRRCGRGSFGICCWRCWHAMPAHFREMFDGAKTTEAKREFMAAILGWIERNPAEAENPC